MYVDVVASQSSVVFWDTLYIPLQTGAHHILAYVHSPPMQMHREISEVTGLKFAQF